MSSLTLLGLFFVAIIAWHFVPKSKPPGPSPKFRRDVRATADDPQWQSFIEEHCESPAETAFLRAMIKTHNLRPDAGSLVTDGLKLDLQVQEGGYRVDFLANNWLVIEIDGGAYHSSEEAIKRDQDRDRYFEDLGYSVIRIPAKVVFADPDEAVRRVGSILDIGEKKFPLKYRRVVSFDFNRTMSILGRAVGEINENAIRIRKVSEAMKDVRRIFSTEKVVIDSAIDYAVRHIRIEGYIDYENKERQDKFDHFKQELEEAFQRFDAERSDQTWSNYQSVVAINPISLPLPVGEPDIDASVRWAYQKLVEERAAYMDNARRQIQHDPRLGVLVKDMLAKTGCPQVWTSIS